MSTLRLAALGLGAAALLVLALLAAAPLLQDWSLMRSAIVLVAGSSALAVLAGVVITLRRLQSDLAVAELVGGRHPGLRSDLLSTIELLREQRTRFSPALFAALARQTWLHLNQHPPSTTVAAYALLRPGAWAVGAAAVSWMALGVWKGPDLERSARILAGLEREAPRLAPARVVGDLVLRYEYPAYMKREAREVRGSTGNITAPLGTRVELLGKTTVPASEAWIVVSERPSGARSEARHKLRLARGASFRGSIKVDRSAQYEIEIVDRDGRALRDPVQQRIDVEPDLAPKAALRGPPDHAEVGAMQLVELGYSAEDDWGLSRIELVWQRNDNLVGRTALWESAPTKSPPHAAGRHTWDIDRLDLEAGGRVAYWIEAVDNDTVSGPKRTRSQVRYLAVFSAEERHDRTLAVHRQLLESSLELLSDRLLMEASAPPSPRQRHGRARAFLALHARQASFSDGVRELGRQMSQDELVSPAIRRSIASMERRLQGLLSAEKRHLGRFQGLERDTARRPISPKSLSLLQRQNRGAVSEMERDALLLSSLLDEQRLQSIAGAAERLKSARKHLNELLQRYAKTRDPKLKREILAEIARMQRHLEKLASDLSRVQGTIPDEYLNAEAVQKLDVRGDLRQLRNMIEQGQLDQLEGALKALDDKLARMDDLLQQNLSEFRAEHLTERERAYGRVLDQLHELENAQRRLARRTEKLNQRYRERGGQLLKNDVGPRLKEELTKVKRLARRIDELKQRPLDPYQNEQMERIGRWTKWLQEAVARTDLAPSLDMARRIADGLDQLSDEMREDVMGMAAPWRRQQKTIEGLEQAHGLAQEIEADLDSLYPSAETLLQPEERAELRRWREQQLGLKKRMQTLLQKKGKPTGGAGDSQLLTPKQQAALRQSDDLMGDAAARLSRLQPQQAHGAQRAAADRLAEIRQQLQRARDPRGGAAGQAPYRERVEIPDARAFAPPKAFRQELLEAMKEAPPKGYEPVVEHYYRELVR